MSVVVLDFDGTMADSFKVGLEVFNEIAEKKGFKKVTNDDWQKIRRMSIPKAMKYLGIRTYQAPGVLASGRKAFLNHVDDIKLFRGIDELIKELTREGHNIFVLSTNSQEFVNKVLRNAGLDEYVRVLKSTAILGKASALRRLTRMTGSQPSDIWMVGDELRDGVAARKARCNFIAVTWGLQPHEILEKANPSLVAHVPRDIINAVS